MRHAKDKCGAALHSFLKRICLSSKHFCPYFVQICRALLRSFCNLARISDIKSYFFETRTLPVTSLFPSSFFCSLAAGSPVPLIAELFLPNSFFMDPVNNQPPTTDHNGFGILQVFDLSPLAFLQE